MSISLDYKKKVVLVLVVLAETALGSLGLFNFYQKKIVHKTQSIDEITVIKKENLIFPKESEYLYYTQLKPDTEILSSPEWLGREIKYTHNSDGLNDRFNYSVEKPSDVFRIITLGDSFTYGQNVDTKDNWTEKLEDLLNESNNKQNNIKKFEVINLGMGAFDVPYIVKRYKEIGAKYNPDLIIWFESSTGFNRLSELTTSYSEKCENETSEVLKKQEFYYCWDRAREEIGKKYSKDEVYSLITSYLDDFFLHIDKKDFLFVVYEGSSLGSEQLEGLEYWQKKYSDVTFLQIPSIYKLNLQLKDGHPSVEGHQMMASSIYEYLKSNLIQ